MDTKILSKLVMILTTLLITFNLIAQNCNDGFETNSFAGWSGAKGTNSGGYSVSFTTFNTSPPEFGIETATIIPCSDSAGSPGNYQPIVPLGFGQYSARLGEVNVPIAKVEMLTYTFVPTSNDTSFLYAYSTFLQAPGHGPNDNPYFVIGLLDQNGDTIPGSLYLYQTGTTSTLGLVVSNCSSGLYFKPWTIRGINLSSYAGQVVTLFAVNADCAFGGHFAYSYIDMDCDGVLNVPIQPMVTLSAISEAGSSYLWNTGATTPTITVNNPLPNSMYSCKVTLPSYYSPTGPVSFYVTYKITDTTTIVKQFNQNNSNIYPNPTNDFLYLKNKSDVKKIELFDISGSAIKVKEIDLNKNRIDVSNLSNGIYFVRIYRNDDEFSIEKIVIQH
jgi:hypothetical protein